MSGKSELPSAKKRLYDLAGQTTVEALKKRHFDAYYVETKEEAEALLWTLIPSEHSVGWGGSDTVQSLDLPQKLRDRGYTVIDRDTAKSPEERQDIMRQALHSDTFLMSANAISSDGQMVNIDGNGNRIAALMFGPKSVIVLAGMNKVVKTLDDAIHKVRHFTAPLRTQCFDYAKTPCKVTGTCHDCASPDCSCAQMAITRMGRPAKRIKFILIGEDIGF